MRITALGRAWRRLAHLSGDWNGRTAGTSDIAAQRSLAEIIPLKGGIPRKIGNETIGAVGRSGSSTDATRIAPRPASPRSPSS